jgi:hypothetical protein
MVPGQPGQKVCKIPPYWKKRWDIIIYTCHTRAKLAWAKKKMRTYLKNNQMKKGLKA